MLREGKGRRATLLKYHLQACLALPTLAGMHVHASAPPTVPLTNKTITKITTKYRGSAKQRVLAWQNLIVSAINKSEAEKVGLVNEFFNQVRFVTDQEHWGENDFWATPLEMLATNGGDCEDFSIAKYFTLKVMGIPVERLRITHVITKKLKQSHIVLTYYPVVEQSSLDAGPLVLDNLKEMVAPLSQRSDLLPVYSFNSQGLWVQKKQGQAEIADPHRIKLWSTLITKMEQQGLYL